MSKRVLTPSLVLLAAMTWSAAQAQREMPADLANKTIQQGNQLRQSGDIKHAIIEYDKVKKDGGTPELKLEAALKVGESRMLLSQAEKLNPRELDAAVKEFQLVIKNGSSEQKARAHNSLATVYLLKNEPLSAIKSLQAFEWSQIEPEQHYVLHYNLGRAYDKAGDANGAIKEYHKALKKNAHFQRGAERTVELIQRSRNPDVGAEAYQVGLTLLDQGQLTQAKTLGVEMLLRKELGTKAELGFAVLIRAYVKMNWSPERLLAEEGPVWNRLETSGYVSAAGELRRGCSPGLEIAIQKVGGQEVKEFPWFSSRKRDERVRQEFASLLNQVGNHYAGADKKPRNPKQALARFLLAWSISGNSEAAQNLAWILAASHQEIDPEKKLYDNLIDVLFDGKNKLYALDYKTREDWENILRMHLMLGMIFEAQGKWGSVGEPRSAIFQWTLAVRAEEQVRKLDTGRGYRAAGLHHRLANAYQKIGERAKAFDHFLEAGEKYFERGEVAQVREVLRAAEQLKFEASPAQVARFNELRRKSSPEEKSKELGFTGLKLQPPTVAGGATSQATVTLSGPAPPSGVVLKLTSDEAAATVPAEVKVEAGQFAATFTITTHEVKKNTRVLITAALGSVRQSVTLTVGAGRN